MLPEQSAFFETIMLSSVNESLKIAVQHFMSASLADMQYIKMLASLKGYQALWHSHIFIKVAMIKSSEERR